MNYIDKFYSNSFIDNLNQQNKQNIKRDSLNDDTHLKINSSSNMKNENAYEKANKMAFEYVMKVLINNGINSNNQDNGNLHKQLYADIMAKEICDSIKLNNINKK